MVTVRSAVSPVYPEENRPLRSIVSNAAKPQENSFAHTPTVNAGSSLAVADTILLFLSTLRPYPEVGGWTHSNSPEGDPEGQFHPPVKGSEGQSAFGFAELTGMYGSNEPLGQEDLGPDPFSTSSTDRSSKEQSDNAVSSLLSDLMRGPAFTTGTNSGQVNRRQSSDSHLEPTWKRTNGFFAESFVMSQTSIALMFGHTLNEKPSPEKPTGSAQNDNRASARYRQQSPDNWGGATSANVYSFVSSDRAQNADRGLILRARFTEAGTYQFG